MPTTDVRKRVLYFVLFVGTLALILFLFPYAEDSIRSYLGERFNLVWQDGTFSGIDSAKVDPMIETSVNLLTIFLKILRVIIWMMLIVSVVRFVLFIFTRSISGKVSPGEVSSILQTVVSVVIYVVAFFVIFQSQFPTIQLAPIFTGSTIIGIVVGLALQDTLGNLFAGLALQADQPFQVGDFVMIPGRGEGVIEKVSWRGVTIRTSQNKLLVISNSVLGKDTIEVSPKNNLNAKSVFFNTLYTQSPAYTIQVVREAVRQVENVSRKMRPVVRIRNLAADGIDFEVKYWLDDYTRQHDTDALIRQRIWYVFKREGIEFAYPTRTIYTEEKVEQAAPEEIINMITERLNQVSIFSPLADDEIERLANATTTRVYAPDEPIVRTGQVGNSMFLIARGSVRVEIPDGAGRKPVGTLGPNEFFGEMSLLTGEPRSAHVVAVEETEVLRIDKNGLKPILEDNPSLVEAISEMIEERRASIQPTDDDLPDDAQPTKKRALVSIRRFFGLKK